jgi:hypothetical protein
VHGSSVSSLDLSVTCGKTGNPELRTGKPKTRAPMTVRV